MYYFEMWGHDVLCYNLYLLKGNVVIADNIQHLKKKKPYIRTLKSAEYITNWKSSYFSVYVAATILNIHIMTYCYTIHTFCGIGIWTNHNWQCYWDWWLRYTYWSIEVFNYHIKGVAPIEFLTNRIWWFFKWKPQLWKVEIVVSILILAYQCPKVDWYIV